MNKKILGFAAAIVVFVLAVVLIFEFLPPSQVAAQELDFTVSGVNDCLRFLNSTVSTVYVPIRTGANENWELTINCTKMPGGANGWTDVYIYRGYWDEGSDHKCLPEDLYPILSEIESADFQIRSDSPFKEVFGGSTPERYTVFFIFPPGGEATFHVTYEKV